MSDGDKSNSSMAHVSVKLLPFYKKSPSTWFRQMESQFHLAKITNDETKFHHILAALPEEIASFLPLDEEASYEKLKKLVIDSLKANHHQLIEEALSAVELGDKRPTQLVVEIKRKFADIGITPDEAIIKSRILSALPPNIKAALVGHDSASLDDYVKIADSMMAVAAPMNNPYAINAIPNLDPNNKFHKPFSQRHNYQNNERNFRSSVRPFYRDQRPRICNAHIFYAENARTCRKWCRWPNKPEKLLKDFEKTPVQSRSSSPSGN